MQKQLVQVAAFQSAFGQKINNEPTLIESDTYKLRFELMKEENEEYLEACQNNDIVEIADALGDQLYILCGTILSHGMQYKIEEIFSEIQRSNMSKLDDDGNPIINGQNGVFDESRAMGKILKSSNFSEPNLKQFL
jgi:predicted HAD superfamily Cof-like phosphohydrolase